MRSGDGGMARTRRRTRLWLWLVTLALGFGSCLAFPMFAQAFVFWSNEFGSTVANTLGRDTIDGNAANINQSFVVNGNDPKGVAIDGNFIYWANFGGNSIGRANLNGSNIPAPNPNFITGAVQPEGVAVQGNYIYWANTNKSNPTASSIGCDTIDGNPANVNQNMITGTDFPVGLALNPSGNTIYWANFLSASGTGTIGSATVNGCTATGVNQAFIPSGQAYSPIGPAGVATDGTNLYWANYSSTAGAGTIGRYTLGSAESTTSINESFINTGASLPLALALDGTFIYWTNQDGTTGGAGTVGRDTLDGNAAKITNPFITGAAASQVWGLAVADPPVNTAPPSISGQAMQGQTLTESPGTWTGSNSPTTYALQWQQCNTAGLNCAAIAGATGSTFVPTFAQAGSTLRIQVTATNLSGGTSEPPPAASAPTAVVVGLPPANTAAPTISGTAVAGQTLTEAHGTWTDNPFSFSYQWLLCDASGANCNPIVGSTTPTFVIGNTDAGRSLRVQEAASNQYGTSSPASSAAIAVAPLAQPSVASASMHGASAAVVIACTGAAPQTCSGTYTMTSHETVVGKSVTAVTASKRKTTKPKPLKKQVTVGSGSYNLAAGATETLNVSLNKTGKKLLTQFYKVPVTVTLTGATSATGTLAFNYPVIRSPIAFTWAFTAHATVAQLLTVSRVPSKGKVTVTCNGSGCPFSKRSFSAHNGKVALASFFKHGLGPHATVEIVISATNEVAKVVTFTIQRSAQPTVAALCLPPGAKRPSKCV
jgi:hypothetical protein